MPGRRKMREYDLHLRGTKVDAALARLERIIAQERGEGGGIFAVVTGYGSSGGTSLIKEAVLAACARYARQCHIAGFLDGEFAGDVFSPQALAFPAMHALPPQCKRCPNPGVVYICL